MAATFFPLASLFVDILIIIMFFSKKSVKNKETTLFSYLIIANFIECLFDVIGIGYVRNGGDLEIFSFLQKIDMVNINKEIIEKLIEYDYDYFMGCFNV